ncbi:tetratricopeptide repeat protein [Acidipila rosea]|uniref:tetratricopeptide repeat protein n=1 Tax=Acidipila rosea TaxID=768535 RepID=UPI001FB50B3B|nr:tetratricopeptide repeat protein [Acidipila rosea]
MLQTSVKRIRFVSVLGLVICAGSSIATARDLRITIPQRSHLTPVQRLNRDGVTAVQKHQYEKAEALFYKAYLYDPADPFTLNNLGYISELQGQLDRAEKFYKLASEQSCGAIIDRSSTKQLVGHPMMYAFGTLKNTPMRLNRMNVLGVELLSQGQGFEAESLLKQALVLDPQNPFTLNNLGVAAEATGDLESALKYYDQAAASHSTEPIVVTLKRSWRGKPISQMAETSAQDLRKRMRHMDMTQERASMLAMRGVSATNRNDWSAARQDFLEAYSLDPNSAFALNNLGYVSEKEGDLESAKYYYAKARKAGDASARIGMATQSSAQGQHLDAIAGESDQKVNQELVAYGQNRRRETGPIELTPRNGSMDTPEASPKKPSPDTPSSDSSSPQ